MDGRAARGPAWHSYRDGEPTNRASPSPCPSDPKGTVYERITSNEKQPSLEDFVLAVGALAELHKPQRRGVHLPRLGDSCEANRAGRASAQSLFAIIGPPEIIYELRNPKWRIRASACLVILSEAEPPNVLEKAVRLAPDKSWAKGDALRAGGKRRCNGLRYESGLDEKRSPAEHLAALVERLHPFVEGIAEVSSWPATHSVTVWLAEHTITDNPEVFVEPDDLGAIAAMKAKLAIDVYFYADEDESGSGSPSRRSL